MTFGWPSICMNLIGTCSSESWHVWKDSHRARHKRPGQNYSFPPKNLEWALVLLKLAVGFQDLFVS